MLKSQSLRSHHKLKALLLATIALIGTVTMSAQTIFAATGVSGAVNGASTNVAANGPALYNISGPTTNNMTGLTFGNGFTMTATGPDSGTYVNSFSIGGTITGDPIPASTALSVGYNFTLGRNSFVSIPGNITWVLNLKDSTNTVNQQIATGTLSALSESFTGSGSYSFTSGVSTAATFLATFQVTYFGNNPMAPPIVTGSMSNTGFGGGGITLNAAAIPEPSTYAAIAGVVILGFTVWNRRRRTKSTA